MQHDAIKALKETQREHIDSGERSDELSSSQSDESSCIDCKSSRINRKRKFSETLSEPQSTVNDNRRDDESVSSASSLSSSSDVDSKKSKTTM
jgi:hypothetical protein